MCSLDDRKGELHWKTTVALTRPLEGLVAQRKTRLTTNQETARSNSSGLEIVCCLQFGEMDQDYPLHRNFAATHFDYCLMIENIQGISDITNEKLAEKVEIH